MNKYRVISEIDGKLILGVIEEESLDKAIERQKIFANRNNLKTVSISLVTDYIADDYFFSQVVYDAFINVLNTLEESEATEHYKQFAATMKLHEQTTEHYH